MAITGLQAPGYLATMVPQESIILFTNSPLLFKVYVSLFLVTGTLFVMWLGEKITDGGVGNGISLLIMIGIIALFTRISKG